MSAEAWMFDLRFNNSLKQCDDGENIAYITIGGLGEFGHPDSLGNRLALILLARDTDLLQVHQYCFMGPDIKVSKEIERDLIVDYLTNNDPEWWWDT